MNACQDCAKVHIKSTATRCLGCHLKHLDRNRKSVKVRPCESCGRGTKAKGGVCLRCEDPFGTNDVDEAVVQRVLDGDVLPTTTAERFAIMAAWLKSGRSEKSLCERMGWRAGRYTMPRGECAHCAAPLVTPEATACRRCNGCRRLSDARVKERAA